MRIHVLFWIFSLKLQNYMLFFLIHINFAKFIILNVENHDFDILFYIPIEFIHVCFIQNSKIF